MYFVLLCLLGGRCSILLTFSYFCCCFTVNPAGGVAAIAIYDAIRGWRMFLLSASSFAGLYGTRLVPPHSRFTIFLGCFKLTTAGYAAWSDSAMDCVGGVTNGTLFAYGGLFVLFRCLMFHAAVFSTDWLSVITCPLVVLAGDGLVVSTGHNASSIFLYSVWTSAYCSLSTWFSSIMADLQYIGAAYVALIQGSIRGRGTVLFLISTYLLCARRTIDFSSLWIMGRLAIAAAFPDECYVGLCVLQSYVYSGHWTHVSGSFAWYNKWCIFIQLSGIFII